MNSITIKIDLALHKFIEAKRCSFEQSPCEIIKKELGLADTSETESNLTKPMQPIKGSNSSRQKFSIAFGDATVSAGSLKECYFQALKRMREANPDFLDELSAVKYSRRRIVAKSPEALYDGDGLAHFGLELGDGYFYDSNLSRQQVESRLGHCSEILGVPVVLT
ncbi:hypothetical protein [Pseudooceanicola algae]|uniref:Uncharacterized protein n=1 Tax=Pseudooceanicola algae TaxID=1537215 RepID=A0A418SIK9_9RHOB|nr:hypothetical protein [Pseudooceanicola algae]QPM91146.1 hypothetical protein PSAL_023950 [Pseudooceanicola algae]